MATGACAFSAAAGCSVTTPNTRYSLHNLFLLTRPMPRASNEPSLGNFGGGSSRFLPVSVWPPRGPASNSGSDLHPPSPPSIPPAPVPPCAARSLAHSSPTIRNAAALLSSPLPASHIEVGSPTPLRSPLLNVPPSPSIQKMIARSFWIACAPSNRNANGTAESIGLSRGVTGYSLHVVPLAIFAWLRHPDNFRAALTEALNCGGDTDTVGAILGAISGAALGEAAIPAEWLHSIAEWPRSSQFIRSLAAKLVDQTRSATALGAASYFWPAVVPRNVFFLGIVLLHGLRRVFPPYR